MGTEEGFALREWRRENAIRLEEKEKREKELLSQMIEEAGEYKVEFYRKREVTCENNKVTNREKEKICSQISHLSLYMVQWKEEDLC
ncbi:clathrin light chain 2-like isoform X2 [Hevea brasiliensis]|uniref:clathrin light chain 2-like isoform X2 n=1 Tax=Hevea brasiliensis TaxID=3981 RepID=UPI0025E9DF16|nr:clathrin light chain 2-like isoform X2 [Hevea brasiliensis]